MTYLHTEGLQIGEALRAAEAITDPIERFHALDATHEQVVALAAAIRIAQGAALAELRPGTPWGVLAERAGVRSYQHVQKLVSAARAAQREERSVGTTTYLHGFGTYDHSHHTPEDAVRDYLGDSEGDYDVDGLTAAYRAAINTELDGTGITINGAEFLANYPAPDNATELIEAAIRAVDLGPLAADYDTTEEQK